MPKVNHGQVLLDEEVAEKQLREFESDTRDWKCHDEPYWEDYIRPNKRTHQEIYEKRRKKWQNSY